MEFWLKTDSFINVQVLRPVGVGHVQMLKISLYQLKKEKEIHTKRFPNFFFLYEPFPELSQIRDWESQLTNK
eukprot:TRINITY_DN3320_c2_g5_i1.p1 TRINITY_DN3320_c2_g5~~TRINITY_DN3320_c2_g5_i1.p1  ORF type:complete len:72 (+),score=3.63 TRINITY_DN3320_c2_g5_i1:56-271(+)